MCCQVTTILLTWLNHIIIPNLTPLTPPWHSYFLQIILKMVHVRRKGATPMCQWFNAWPNWAKRGSGTLHATSKLGTSSLSHLLHLPSFALNHNYGVTLCHNYYHQVLALKACLVCVFLLPGSYNKVTLAFYPYIWFLGFILNYCNQSI